MEVGEGSGEEDEEVEEDGWWYGRMEYSPVSHMRRLPVVQEADSMRWFWEGFSYVSSTGWKL